MSQNIPSPVPDLLAHGYVYFLAETPFILYLNPWQPFHTFISFSPFSHMPFSTLLFVRLIVIPLSFHSSLSLRLNSLVRPSIKVTCRSVNITLSSVTKCVRSERSSLRRSSPLPAQTYIKRSSNRHISWICNLHALHSGIVTLHMTSKGNYCRDNTYYLRTLINNLKIQYISSTKRQQW
jgi:hypothetical protein